MIRPTECVGIAVGVEVGLSPVGTSATIWPIAVVFSHFLSHASKCNFSSAL
jgi:hypothetical protein